jgi:predicted  nucleic acid-binding Zn-ribbon protein
MMPRRPLSVEQQAAAIEKVQQQATQRVKLGQQLFEAADARLKQHQKVLDEINDQQKILREQVQDDVAKSLQTYDQWMGRIDESFTKSIRDLTQRLDQLEERVDGSQNEMQDMLAKAGALLQQTQNLLAETFGDADEIAQAMQASANTSHDYDLDELAETVQPDPQSRIVPEPDAEVIEVDIVTPTDDSGMPQEPEPEVDQDDVFGQVLRRLRSEGDDGHAAA